MNPPPLSLSPAAGARVAQTRTHYGFGAGRSATPALRAAKPFMGCPRPARSGASGAAAALTGGGSLLGKGMVL